jgi:hypothetical protein
MCLEQFSPSVKFLFDNPQPARYIRASTEETQMIERREGEEITAFTMRRIRAEILEQAAKEADEMGRSAFNLSYMDACSDVAKRIRKMADE